MRKKQCGHLIKRLIKSNISIKCLIDSMFVKSTVNPNADKGLIGLLKKYEKRKNREKAYLKIDYCSIF